MILQELYDGFTNRFLPFYRGIINVDRGVSQGGTSRRDYSSPLSKAMGKLEWEKMEVEIDVRQSHHLRFADDMVLITPDISQAERMLADFDRARGKIGLQLNVTKTMYMKNGWVSDAPFTFNGTNISECSSYVYLGTR